MAEATSEDSTATISIVDLPEHLLLHIFSLLPSTLDATHTSLVCRKWRNIWHSLPSLDFSHTHFPLLDTPLETLRCFTDFIIRTLILRSCKTSILHFRLQFPVIDLQHVSHINSWIRYAINNGVLHLNIDTYVGDFIYTNYGMNSDDLLVDYEFPFPILINSCVSVLKLRCCAIWLPAKSQFVSLRSVTIERVSLTEQMFSDLMLACVSLEDLVLERIWGLKDLKICSPKLRKLSIRGFFCGEGSLNVDAPNLLSLKISRIHVREYEFKETESLVEVQLLMRFSANWSKFVRLHGNVKHLSIYNCWFKLRESKEVPFEGLVFNNLNVLEMHTGFFAKRFLLGIAAICELSHNLETLILNGLFDLDNENEILSEEDMKSISFNVPRLRRVKINDFRGTNNELLFVKHLEEQGEVLENIVLVPAYWDEVSLDGLKELKLSKDILHVHNLNSTELH